METGRPFEHQMMLEPWEFHRGAMVLAGTGWERRISVSVHYIEHIPYTKEIVFWLRVEATYVSWNPVNETKEYDGIYQTHTVKTDLLKDELWQVIYETMILYGSPEKWRLVISPPPETHHYTVPNIVTSAWDVHREKWHITLDSNDLSHIFKRLNNWDAGNG